MPDSELDRPSLPVENKPRVILSPGMSVPGAVSKILEDQMAVFESMLPVALRGEDIEGVHKVRVSLRRMRTCLKVTRPYYQNKHLEATRIDLKFVREVFGRVRDMDVFKHDFSEYYESLGMAEEFVRTIWQPVFSFTYNDYSNQIHAQVTMDIINQLRQSLGGYQSSNSLLQQSKDKLSTLPEDVRTFLPQILSSQLESIQNFVLEKEVDRNYPRHHKLRLLIKAHRYTYEFFQSVLDPDASNAIIDRTIQLQDVLGALNDSVQAIRFLSTHQSPRFSDPVAETLEAYIDYQRERQNSLVTGFPRIFAQFQEASPQSMLEAAISPL